MTPYPRASARWVVLCLLGLLVPSCDGNEDPRAPTSVVVGPGGTTFTVTSGPLAGTSLTVPAGAMPSSTLIRIDPSSTSAMPDSVAVGPAAVLGPFGTTFSAPATLTLVFDPTRLPAGLTGSDLVVKRRSSHGRITDIAPTAVDLVAGTANASITEVASFWVAAQIANGVLALVDYLPLAAGDRYRFENGLQIDVAVGQTEPNLGGPVSMMTLSADALREGFYLSRLAGETLLVGRFDVLASFQEVHDVGATLLPALATLGSVTQTADFYSGYEPFGALVPAYFGITILTVTVVSAGRLDTPLGRFDDVIELRIETERSDTRIGSTQADDRLWLARGLGPVQVELTGLGPPAALTAAVVNGVGVQAP